MLPKEKLTMVKNDIGLKLSILKTAKQNKDNYGDDFIQRIKEGLSLALRWKIQLYRENPDLQPKKDSRQMSFLTKLRS